jgi:hypothetical protein
MAFDPQERKGDPDAMTTISLRDLAVIEQSHFENIRRDSYKTGLDATEFLAWRMNYVSLYTLKPHFIPVNFFEDGPVSPYISTSWDTNIESSPFFIHLSIGKVKRILDDPLMPQLELNPGYFSALGLPIPEDVKSLPTRTYLVNRQKVPAMDAVNEYIVRVKYRPYQQWLNSLTWEGDPLRYIEYLAYAPCAGVGPGGDPYPVWAVDRFREKVTLLFLKESFFMLKTAQLRDRTVLTQAYTAILNTLLPKVKSAVKQRYTAFVRPIPGVKQALNNTGKLQLIKYAYLDHSYDSERLIYYLSIPPSLADALLAAIEEIAGLISVNLTKIEKQIVTIEREPERQQTIERDLADYRARFIGKAENGDGLDLPDLPDLSKYSRYQKKQSVLPLMAAAITVGVIAAQG